jgi:hypothetical protein
VLARTNPAQALAIDGGNLRALTKIADKHFVEGRGEQPLPSNVSAALRLQLLAQPLDSRALRLLGMDAALTSDEERALALMNASSNVSRRDAGAQLYLMRQAALENDWGGTMSHLDAVLSSRPAAWEHLFPFFFKLLGYREFRDNLTPLLQQERPWAVPFLRQAVETAPNVDAVAALLREAQPIAGGQPAHEVEARVLARYAAMGEVVKADAFARDVLELDDDVLSNAGLTPATTVSMYAPLTWQLSVPDNVNVTIDGEQANVRVTAGPPSSAMTRYFALPAGKHRFHWSLRRPQLTPLAEGAFAVQCPQGDKLIPLGSRRLGSREGRASIDFTVPSDCDGVRIDLLAEGNVTGAVAEVTLFNLRIASR